MIDSKIGTTTEIPAKLPGGNGGFKLCPNLLTENQLIRFLRIPQISKDQNYRNAIAHLKRYRNLPYKGLSFPARLFYCIRSHCSTPHIVKRTGQTRKAGITASHRPVFDLPHGAERDPRSYIPCWSDLAKNVPAISV